VTHVSLFSGIGGIDIAAEQVGFRTVAQVERDPYCLKVLERHWPGVHRVKDIRDFPDKDYGAVTLVSGGFPCQPFSAAGKRRGKEDDRYLWPEMRRVIAEIKPAWVVAENVAGLTSMAQFDSLPELGSSAGDRYHIGDVYRRTGSGILRTILEEIEALGYEVTPIVVPAAGVGAPHYRYRVFIVAHAERNRRQQGPEVFCGEESVIAASSEDVPDTDKQHGHNSGHGTGEVCREQREEAELPESKDATHPASGSEQSGGTQCDVGRFQDQVMQLTGDSGHWAVEPDVGRVAHGVPKRVDRLRCLGNAVVPQQVYPILQAIAEVER